MQKSLSTYKNIIVLFFTFSVLSLNAKTLTEELNHAEYLIHSDVKSAIPLLQNLHPKINSASKFQTIRWLFLSMDTAILNFNHNLAEEIVSQASPLLLRDISNSGIWLQLLKTGLYITSDEYNLFLPRLESIEQAVMDSKDSRLIAYFNRMLH